VKVHSFTLFCTPKSMRYDSWASLLARNLASPCFVRKPKVRVSRITLISTFHAVFLSMSRVFIFMLTSYPRLAKLLCLCRCPPFLCYTLVLSFLLFGVGFAFSLASFWGCLRLILHALVCFIGSFEPSRMRLSRLFTYPLTELLKIQLTS
jgi:hypothetical protein